MKVTQEPEQEKEVSMEVTSLTGSGAHTEMAWNFIFILTIREPYKNFQWKGQMEAVLLQLHT